MDGDVGGVVDDDLLGGRGLASWGAPEQLVCFPVKLWRPWGGLSPQIVLHHCLVEDVVGGVVVSRLLLDHDLRGVEGGLVDGYGSVRLAKVLSGWGRGQADHLVVFVVVGGFFLDPDLLELSFADVVVVFSSSSYSALGALGLVWGEAWSGFWLAGPDSLPLLGLPGVEVQVPCLLLHDGLAGRRSYLPPFLLLLLAGHPLALVSLGLGGGLG